MKIRYILIGLVAVFMTVAIFFFKDPPGSMFECKNSVADCIVGKGLMVLVLVVGVRQLINDSIFKYFSTGTSVKVIDENGRERMGLLSNAAIQGRDVHSGDTVWINCTPEPNLPGGKRCYLDFVKIDPNLGRFDVNPRYGSKPSWDGVIDAKGVPDSRFLKYEN